jgi:hypothetical protein
VALALLAWTVAKTVPCRGQKRGKVASICDFEPPTALLGERKGLTRNSVSFIMALKMKKINIFLAETTYEALAGHAALEAVEVSQFCSAVLTEFADGKRQYTNNEHLVTTEPTNQNAVPDTVAQVLSVSKYVWVDGLEFNEAINRTAQDFSVQGTTVRDKCTRRISLANCLVDTTRFLKLLSQPPSLPEHLCQKFPKYKAEIMSRFNKLITNDRAPQTSLPIGNNPIKPAVDINEKQLVQAIITTLNENGGSALKSVVEDSVFQKFKYALDDPYYHELVGPQVGFPGVPRWRKNIEFARNTARQMGLVKPPEESGRGVWALTEAGKIWGGQ